MQHALTRTQASPAQGSAASMRGFVRNTAMIVGTIYAATITVMVGFEPQMVTITPFWVVSLIVMATVTATYLAGHRLGQTSAP